MIYRAIGVMSGSSLDGLDVTFAEFQENIVNAGSTASWSYTIRNSHSYTYTGDWVEKLRNATALDALRYQLLHVEFGSFIGDRIIQFIADNNLHYQVALICSHGHTTFHSPSKKMTAQLGDGAAIAAKTELPVVTDLRALDVAFGGQGAPIVPIGERMLLGGYDFFLNLGGIANISLNREPYIAFDVCPANRVLNMLANDAGREYDDQGQIAASGEINFELLNELNDLEYYHKAHPKSLANDFGTDTVYPMIRNARGGVPDALRTYVEHIIIQLKNALINAGLPSRNSRMLVTGGGAFNGFLLQRIVATLQELNIEVVVPDTDLIKYKEALVMAFMGVLRWRQEYNVLASVTGAARNSIGGALWTGQEG